MSFENRTAKHERACRMLKPIFEGRGFDMIPHGVEEQKRLQSVLQQSGLDDQCSLMVRFRPDIVAVKPYVQSLLCEVKSTDNAETRDLYTIEARAYRAMMFWGELGHVVMVTMCDPENDYAAACWAQTICEPRTVFVPRRFDAEQQFAAMGEMFPDAAIKYVEHKRGSGTPYVFVSRRAFMLTLEEFIDQELLGLYVAEPEPAAPVQQSLFSQ